MKRIIALILALITIFTFASCTKTNTPTADDKYAIIAGDTKIYGAALYSEIFSYKNDFLLGYLGLTEDSPTIWEQDSPAGRMETVGDTLTRMAIEDMVQFAWVVEYARDNGAVIGEEDKQLLEEGYAAMKENFETEEEYQEYLTMLGFTDETIREYLGLTIMYDKGFQLLTMENGLYPIPEEDYYKYYEENFYTVKHIFINDVNKTDEEGNVVLLTEEESKAQADKAEQVYADLQEGKEFDTLYLLSEDDMSNLYPDGLTFTQGMIDSAYEEAAIGLKEGEYTMISGSEGGIYIILRMPLSESGYEEYTEYVRSAVSSTVQEKIYSQHKNEVTVNYDLVNTYKIADMPVMAGYKS